MKSQIRLGLCLALGLSLYACSSEGEPIGPKTPPVPEERPAFTLDLEAEGALSELRGDFNLDFKVGSKGALKVNVKENEEYKARCFLRQMLLWRRHLHRTKEWQAQGRTGCQL